MATHRSRPVRTSVVAGASIAVAGASFLAILVLADANADIVVAAPEISIVPGGPATAEPPPAADVSLRRQLSALSGLLRRCDAGHCIKEIPLDFGVPWYLATTQAPTDYDGDGVDETLRDEISGLVGKSVTLTVEYGRFGDVSVFAIDGVFFRPEFGRAPWVGVSPPVDPSQTPNATASDESGPVSEPDQPDQDPEDGSGDDPDSPPDTEGPPASPGPPAGVPRGPGEGEGSPPPWIKPGE